MKFMKTPAQGPNTYAFILNIQSKKMLKPEVMLKVVVGLVSELIIKVHKAYLKGKTKTGAKRDKFLA